MVAPNLAQPHRGLYPVTTRHWAVQALNTGYHAYLHGDASC